MTTSKKRTKAESKGRDFVAEARIELRTQAEAAINTAMDGISLDEETRAALISAILHYWDRTGKAQTILESTEPPMLSKKDWDRDPNKNCKSWKETWKQNPESHRKSWLQIIERIRRLEENYMHMREGAKLSGFIEDFIGGMKERLDTSIKFHRGLTIDAWPKVIFLPDNKKPKKNIIPFDIKILCVRVDDILRKAKIQSSSKKTMYILGAVNVGKHKYGHKDPSTFPTYIRRWRAELNAAGAME